jgi:hypothetical protein
VPIKEGAIAADDKHQQQFCVHSGRWHAGGAQLSYSGFETFTKKHSTI